MPHYVETGHFHPLIFTLQTSLNLFSLNDQLDVSISPTLKKSIVIQQRFLKSDVLGFFSKKLQKISLKKIL
jgi:hypothetical protein